MKSMYKRADAHSTRPKKTFLDNKIAMSRLFITSVLIIQQKIGSRGQLVPDEDDGE